MLSKVPRKRPHLNAFLEDLPTACNKKARLEIQRVTDEYKKKPLPQWQYEDMVSFSLEGRLSGADFDLPSINYMTGTEFASLSIDKFLKFSPKYGNELYVEVQGRLRLDRGSSRQHYPASNSNTPSPPAHAISTSTSSPLISPSYNNLRPHQPSVICDAVAPHEVRIEPPSTQPPLRCVGGAGWPGMFITTPTAAFKSASPAFKPLNSAMREGRREIIADDNAGRGGSSGGGERTEQDRPVHKEVKFEKRRRPGRPKKPESELKKKKKKTRKLWEFIRNLLFNPETCPTIITWENAEKGQFRFVEAEKVAKMWGEYNNEKENKMNYDKLSRAMR